MPAAPPFFVPAATTPEEQESVYASFAAWCSRPVPDLGARIYSITWIHNGEQWTATVGERLHGTKQQFARTRGRRVEHTVPLSDPALVLAIFPGVPFFVVTNHRIVGNIGSAWENPFMAGSPTSVVRFSAT
jgi:hypothetical protein